MHSTTTKLIYRFKLLVELRPRRIALHGVSDDGLGERLGAAGLADEEERDSQLDADHHHKDVLLQSLILGNVFFDDMLI